MTSSSKPAEPGTCRRPPGAAGFALCPLHPARELGDFASWKPSHFGATPELRRRRLKRRRRAPTTGRPAWRRRGRPATRRATATGSSHSRPSSRVFAQQATSQIGALLEAFDRQLGEIDAGGAGPGTDCGAAGTPGPACRTAAAARAGGPGGGRGRQRGDAERPSSCRAGAPAGSAAGGRRAPPRRSSRGARLQAIRRSSAAACWCTAMSAPSTRASPPLAQAAAALGSELPLADETGDAT